MTADNSVEEDLSVNLVGEDDSVSGDYEDMDAENVNEVFHYVSVVTKTDLKLLMKASMSQRMMR